MDQNEVSQCVFWLSIFFSHMLTFLMVVMAIGNDHNFLNNDIQCNATELGVMFSSGLQSVEIEMNKK